MKGFWLTFAAVLACLPAAGQATPDASEATNEQTLVAAGSKSQPAVEGPAEPQPVVVTDELRGDIFVARKMYRDAIDMYKSIEPETAVLWNKIGIAYQHLGDLRSAKNAYKKAIKMDRMYPEPVNNLGTVKYAERDYKDAAKQYEKALRLSPYKASFWSNLGMALFAREKYEQAYNYFVQALILDPRIFERRDSGPASTLMERSVEDRARFEFSLAKAYARAGLPELAMQYIRKAIEDGFKEREKLVEDPDFASLQELPEFQELLVYDPRVL